jgi:APA family basic amino acid/polyamine antiporter
VTGARLKGQKSAYLSELNPHTNIPNNSAILGLLCSALWLFYFYGANVTEGWFGIFNFDSSELPVITIYALYIPIFINFMIKEKSLPFVKRFLIPSLATASSCFIIIATIYAHGISPYLAAREEGVFSFPVLFYLIIFAVIMLGGFLLKFTTDKKEKEG